MIDVIKRVLVGLFFVFGASAFGTQDGDNICAEGRCTVTRDSGRFRINSTHPIKSFKLLPHSGQDKELTAYSLKGYDNGLLSFDARVENPKEISFHNPYSNVSEIVVIHEDRKTSTVNVKNRWAYKRNWVGAAVTVAFVSAVIGALIHATKGEPSGDPKD